MNGYLYCYKMTHDTGFAPNPYHDVLTLATCKPTIRRCAKEGYWISGWTSNGVYDKNNEKHEFTDDTQKLIYLARVTDKIKIEKYWDLYEEKRPHIISNGKVTTTNSCTGKNNPSVYDMGDNIYKPIKGKKGEFEQLPNGGGHDESNKEHDLSGEYVLICKDYYYFGVEQAIELEGKEFVVPRCKKFSLDDQEAKSVIDFVTKNYSQGNNPRRK